MFEMPDFNFNLDNDKKTNNKVKSIKTLDKHFYRRAKSEEALFDELDNPFLKGYSYHVISFGDVDSLSFLKHIIKQQNIKKIIISTWVIAKEDIAQLEKWLDKGIIKEIDFFVGEIYKSRYPDNYIKLMALMKKYKGRFVVFKNHSKVIAGYGDKYDFCVESSANINTNPRCENTVVTLNKELVDFYLDFFKNIKSFCKNDWAINRK